RHRLLANVLGASLCGCGASFECLHRLVRRRNDCLKGLACLLYALVGEFAHLLGNLEVRLRVLGHTVLRQTCRGCGCLPRGTGAEATAAVKVILRSRRPWSFPAWTPRLVRTIKNPLR